MVMGYFIKDDEGWNADPHQVETDLKQIYPGLFIGDARTVGPTIMKVYGIMERDTIIARIDISYRNAETSVIISGNEADSIDRRVREESRLRWERQKRQNPSYR